MRVYFDFRGWWIGYYRGDTYNYVCLIPTLVIRWVRKKHRIENPYLSKEIKETIDKHNKNYRGI